MMSTTRRNVLVLLARLFTVDPCHRHQIFLFCIFFFAVYIPTSTWPLFLLALFFFFPPKLIKKKKKKKGHGVVGQGSGMMSQGTNGMEHDGWYRNVEQEQNGDSLIRLRFETSNVPTLFLDDRGWCVRNI